MKLEPWEIELNVFLSQQAFEEFDALILQSEKDERYRLKRERNLIKADRIRARYYRVKDFDMWHHTRNIDTDFWGDPIPRHDAVKVLYAKRDKILWILRTLYMYWAYDDINRDLIKPNKKTLTYSYLSRKYDICLEKLKEDVLQAKWDKKRARIRARRETIEINKNKPINNSLRGQLKTVLTLRFGASGPELLIPTRKVQEEALAPYDEGIKLPRVLEP